VDDNSGSRQVQGTPDVLQTLGADNIIMKKSGFVYIYTTNESNEDVYFDNLVVTHGSGPLMEETHYYPFGLTMAGISSNALKGTQYPKNRREYNGIEHTTDLDLNQYDAQFRNLDPQIGRWWQIDPKIEKMEMWSPYVSNFDNPVRFSDPNGDFPWILIPIVIGLVTVSQPAVAPTGKASDAPAIKAARDNAGVHTIASFAPGGLKPLARAFQKDPAVEGGRMDALPRKEGFDRHEIPSASSLKNTGKAEKGEAPAVQTPTPLHAETGSFGGARSAREYRAVEQGLLNEGKFEDAFKMGVDNLRVVMKENPQMLKDANITTKDMEKGIKQMENYFKDVLLPKLQRGLNK